MVTTTPPSPLSHSLNRNCESSDRRSIIARQILKRQPARASNRQVGGFSLDKTGTQGRNPSRKEGTWEFRTARKQKGKRRRKEKRKIRARSICIVGRASAIKSFSHSLFLFLGLNLSKDCFLFLQARVFLPSPTCFWQTFQPSFFFCLATRSFWTGSARSLASNLLAHTTTQNYNFKYDKGDYDIHIRRKNDERKARRK